MRVLFTLLPATGSLHPLVPVAHALLDAGHEVRFACAPSFRPAVQQHGLNTDPAGIDLPFSQPNYFSALVAAAGVAMPDMSQLTGHDRQAWVTDNLFIRAAARPMLPDVLALAKEWRPDLVIRESSEFSGCVAAEALDIPHVSVAAAADAALDLRDQTAAALEPLRSAAGLPPDPDADMVYRYLDLSFMPAGFFGPAAHFPTITRFLRHVGAPRPGRPVPDWWQQRPDQPTVVVSLGAVFFRTPGLYGAIIDGLGGEQLAVAVAVGHDQDLPPVDHPNPDVHVEPILPLPALLRDCDLFITHGGFNSIKEAVNAGTPMLVVPIASDQHYSADRVEALGIGRVIRPHERTPGRIRDQALAVLNDPNYRNRSAALATEMAALPTIDHALNLLQALA